MPVNEKNGSGDLLEQGWSRMQGILDQELPGRKKRWGLWIPLSVLGIVILVVTGIYFSQDKKAKTAPVEQANPHQSFAQSETGSATILSAVELQGNSRDAVEYNALGKTISNSTDDKNIVDEHAQGETLAGEISMEKSLTQASPSPIISNKDRSTSQIAKRDNTGIKTASNASLGEVADKQNTDLEHSTTVLSAETRNIIDNDALSGSDVTLSKLNNTNNQHAANEDNTQKARYDVVAINTIDAVDIAELNEGPLATPVIVVAPKVRPRTGLDAFFAPHFAAPVQLQGYEFGALATVSIGKKWKVMSGASFGHYNKSGVLQFGGLSQDLKAEALFVPTIPDTSTINYPGTDPEVAYDLIGYDTAQLLTEVLNYLHIPVLGQYRVTNFLSVISGVKFSYLINAPTSRGLSAFPLAGSSPGTLDLQNSRNFLAEENILRSWDIAPVIGLALNVGARLALDVQYQHGMIAYVDRPTEGDRSDYQRTLSIGLRYSFF